MTPIEVETAKHLVLEVAELGAQKIAGCPRACERGTGTQRLRQLPPGYFGRGLQFGVAGGPQPRFGTEARAIRGDQLAQRMKLLQNGAREIESGTAGNPRAQQNRQEF